jgi:hypothetical protein
MLHLTLNRIDSQAHLFSLTSQSGQLKTLHEQPCNTPLIDSSCTVNRHSALCDVRTELLHSLKTNSRTSWPQRDLVLNIDGKFTKDIRIPTTWTPSYHFLIRCAYTNILCSLDIECTV